MVDGPTTPDGAGRPSTPRGRWAGRFRREHLALAAILVVALFVRIVWRAHTLTTWDSVLFALALDDFDVYRARPHAPGYPVFVAAARVLASVLPDANAALVALSVVFSLGTLVLLYRFVRLSAPAGVALATVFVFSFAPVFVYNSVIAAAYTAEAFLSLAMALVAWRLIRRPSVATAAWLGAAFGLALGVRSSLLFYMAPMLAVAVLWPLGVHLVWRRRARVDDEAPRGASLSPRHPVGHTVRQVLAAGAAGAVAVLVWLVPMVRSSQGWSRYSAATGYQSRVVVFAEAVWDHGIDALVDHAVRLGGFLEHEARLLVPWVALVAILVALVRWQSRRADAPTDAIGDETRHGTTEPSTAVPWRAETTVPAWFYVLWTGPAILFYLLVFAGWGNGPIGYALVFLPALYALGGIAADRAARVLVAGTHHRAAGRRRHDVAALILAILLVLVPAPFLAVASHAHVVDEVRAHDEWTEAWAALPGTFPPNETAILTTYSWAHVKWYHPDYLAWTPLIVPDEEHGGTRWFVLETRDREDDQPLYEPHLKPETVRPHPIPAHVRTIIVFDFQIAGENGGPRLLDHDIDVQEATLDNGWRVLFFVPDPEQATIEDHLSPLSDLMTQGSR